MFRLTRLITTPSITTNATETFANPNIIRHDPNAPEPITDVSDNMLATYASEHRSTPATIYDEQYARLYTMIVDNPKKSLVNFEIDDLVERTRLKDFGSKAILLDVGCGTGTHLHTIAEQLPTAELYGLDQSSAMLDVARKRIQEHRGRVRLIKGDLNDPRSLYEGMCTHMVCYYFSFYYAKSPRQFFENARRWLQPNGYLCIHLVDPSKFDPVPEVANPIRGISLQRYFKRRKTDAKVILAGNTTNRLYKCDFNYVPEQQRAVFTEAIIDPSQKFVRRHTTKLHMPHHEVVVQIARKSGFRLRHVTSLLEIGDEYEYLCYLQRDDRDA